MVKLHSNAPSTATKPTLPHTCAASARRNYALPCPSATKENYFLFLSPLLFGSYRFSSYIHCHCTTISVKAVECVFAARGTIGSPAALQHVLTTAFSNGNRNKSKQHSFSCLTSSALSALANAQFRAQTSSTAIVTRSTTRQSEVRHDAPPAPLYSALK
jgi:hypothetical protein